MFHRLMTLATTATVVLHALLGCCVHHAHANHIQGHCGETVTACADHHAPLAETPQRHSHSCDDHAHQPHADAVLSHSCDEERAIEQTLEFVSAATCSGSHDPHSDCAEPDCLVVLDQRNHEFELVGSQFWSALLTSALQSSWQAPLIVRTSIGPPPDPHGMSAPLRIQNQVWRL